MKYIKLFEDYKMNNITQEDIIETIKNNGVILTTSIMDLPEHNEETPVTPVSMDEDDITVDVDGNIYNTKLEFVTKIEY